MYFSSPYKKNPLDIHFINLYLHEKIKASPLWYFDSIKNKVTVGLYKNKVIIGLGSIDNGNFFVSRDTADF